MKTLICVPILLLVSAVAVLADEPPSWREFARLSPNKKYVARVKVKDKKGKTAPRQWSYSVTVFAAKGQRNQPLWSCNFAYSGYPGGYLADDGKTFADIRFWYYKAKPVVTIYREGKVVKKFKGADFRLDTTKIRKTASHQLWWADGRPPRINGAKEILITTIDGKVFRINLKTLKLAVR